MFSKVLDLVGGSKVKLFLILAVVSYVGFLHFKAYVYMTDAEKKQLTIKKLNSDLLTKENTNKALQKAIERHAVLYQEAISQQAENQETINDLTEEVKEVFEKLTEAQNELDNYKGRMQNAAIKKTSWMERIANRSHANRMRRVEKLTSRTTSSDSGEAESKNNSTESNDDSSTTSRSKDKNPDG